MIPANILQPLIDIANSVLNAMHDAGVEYGLGIVLLTFLTRLLILPLSVKQIRSMRALSSLQPQIKEIQEKYKDDRQRMQREMMSLYQENQINPLASCFPLLLQLPVFLALFYLLQDDNFQQQVQDSPPVGWLFIPDLTENATGAVLIALIVIGVVAYLYAGR